VACVPGVVNGSLPLTPPERKCRLGSHSVIPPRGQYVLISSRWPLGS
jgi:hypothetical protein